MQRQDRKGNDSKTLTVERTVSIPTGWGGGLPVDGGSKGLIDAPQRSRPSHPPWQRPSIMSSSLGSDELDIDISREHDPRREEISKVSVGSSAGQDEGINYGVDQIRAAQTARASAPALGNYHHSLVHSRLCKVMVITISIYQK